MLTSVTVQYKTLGIAKPDHDVPLCQHDAEYQVHDV